MNRPDGRAPYQLRPIQFVTHFGKYAEGSVLAEFGDTHVLCNVTLDDNLPGWLRQKDKTEQHGWLTAEYALLPRSTQQRSPRERQWPKGRSQEISRLIGRSLRMAVDLERLGARQLIADCDVLQADGGTRTAAISGAWVAVGLALQSLIHEGQLSPDVIRHQIAAVSVGIVDGTPLLDLNYDEDVAAEIDLNVVMTGSGEIVEVQGTAEKRPIGREELDRLIELAASGIEDLIALQQDALSG